VSTRKYMLVILGAIAVMLMACNTSEGSGSEGLSAGDITIEEAWVRPAFFEGGNGAAYMLITNSGDTDDVLLSASTDIAGAVELHESMIGSMEDMQEGEMGDMESMDEMEGMDDMAMMVPLENIPVPAGESVALQVGGMHIMLIDIQDIPEVGDSVAITLNFENAGEVVVNAVVSEEAPE